MALFSMRVQVIQRSAGRSAVAAAAYRAGEKLEDQRTGRVHDYTRKQGVQRTELMFPDNAPAWVQGIGREAFWNAVEAGEKRKDAQGARELYVAIPRELGPAERISIVRDFVQANFVSRGMVADCCWHSVTASDSGENVHCHIMLTMRPLTSDGFGLKIRHERIKDPEGKVYPNGRPVMINSNINSWNCSDFYEKCRESWENIANAALLRAGVEARIDRRSFLERGIARLPEPMLGIAYYMKTVLSPVFREKWGQYHMAKHWQELEQRVKKAFTGLETEPTRMGDRARSARRWFNWFDRQVERMTPVDKPNRAPPRNYTPDMER